LLVGRTRKVMFAVAMANVEQSPVRYRLDDRAHIDLRRLLRTTRPVLSILGVYHSHPSGPAYPSPSDIAGAHYPDWVQVIVGFGGRSARLRAFRLRAGRIHPVRIT
jgi:proteasome lid subunit RPN8/RPN11